MESNWRFNIAEFGRGVDGWILCASVLGTFGLLYVVKESATHWGTWRRDVPTFPGELKRHNGPFPIQPGQRFPYGIPVEDD